MELAIDWDVDIPMDDGVALKANVFRPVGDGRHATLLSYGPYGKELPFQEGYAPRWRILERDYPEALAGSSNRYQCWELVDPEKWVPDGYAVVRVDSRGAGRSPGVIDSWSVRERDDLARCIDWAGAQPWSNGRVGLAGVSYYAMNAWQVAGAPEPPEHLAAICAWEGCSDLYREAAYHGGIRHTFLATWAPRQVENVQHGSDCGGLVNPESGLSVTGDEKLTEAELAANRVDVGESIRAHPLRDDYWAERTADLSAIRVPVLSAGNWGGHGLHLRGNIQGFLEAGTEDRWLEIHGREHWSMFYTDYGVDLQKRFFDYFLKGVGDWRSRQPRVQLQIRQPDDTFVARAESEWPLARTDWRAHHLDAASLALGGPHPASSSSASYDPGGDGLTFWSHPLPEQTEITGPVAAKLFISSDATDADLFLVLRAFDTSGGELLFRGAGDPFTPMAQGWLRASHRALDRERSRSWQPVHPHTSAEPLEPGEIYELDIEIWPTCLVLPAGYRLALTVLGRDFEHGLSEAEMAATGRLGWSPTPTRGCGPYLHQDADDRPAEIFGARVTVHTGPQHPSHLLLPVIPNDEDRP